MDMDRVMTSSLIGWLVGCYVLATSKVITTKDGYRLVTEHTPGDFLVLPHSETKHDLISYSATLS